MDKIEYPVDFADRINHLYPDIAEKLRETQYDPSAIIEVFEFMDRYPDLNLREKLIYPSGRPRTDMRLFLSNVPTTRRLNNLFPHDDILVGSEYRNDVYIIDVPVSIPIVRYAKNTEQGTYYDLNRKEKYCGTFYYYEPGSSFYLNSEKTLVAPNKLMALFRLTNRKTIIEIIEKSKISPDNSDELKSMLEDGYNFEEYDRNLYAVEDIFDQKLCEEVDRQGYDVVLLTLMTGKNRLVSEVLDVRMRSESFKSIVRYV